MAEQSKARTLKMSSLFRIFFRRWQVIVLTTIVCLIVAAAYGSSIVKVYTATAVLTVSPITTSPFSSAAVNQQINITTERAILGSGQVAALAAKELGQKVSSGVLQSNSETAAPTGSQVLEVSVTLTDPASAAEQANALAQAYLQFRSQSAAAVADGYIKQLDTRIAEIQKHVNISDGDRQQLSDLQQQRTALSLVADSPGTVIGFATAPTVPSSLSLKTILVVGLAGGVLLGMALALLRDRTDNKIRFPQRQAEFFDSQVVLLNDDDEESMRWLFRTIHNLGPRVKGKKPVFVGILTLPEGGPPGMLRQLSKIAKAHGLEVGVVEQNEVLPEAVDLGWPNRDVAGPWARHDLVLIDMGGKLSGSRVADLADKMDSMLLAAGPRTRLRRLRSTLPQVQSLQPERLLPIMYQPPRFRWNRNYRRVHRSGTGAKSGPVSASKETLSPLSPRDGRGHAVKIPSWAASGKEE